MGQRRIRRLDKRTLGAGAETFQYDALGHLTGRTSDLGAFTLSYLGQTDQVTSRQLASSTLATTFSYLNNAGDRRLAGIANVGLTAGQFSTFAFISTPEDFVASIGETADTTAVYPAASTQAATYNNLNQLTVLSGQARTYDVLGNLTSDGTRTYSWDAESRLVGIAYPGQPVTATAFTYDGLGRRTTIAEKSKGKGGNGGGKTGARATENGNTQALEKRIEEALGLKADLKLRGAGEQTLLTLEIRDFDQLDTVVERLTRR